MKKREKEKGRNVVAVILDRYEEHSSDWKKYGDEGAAGRRTVLWNRSYMMRLGGRN